MNSYQNHTVFVVEKNQSIYIAYPRLLAMLLLSYNNILILSEISFLKWNLTSARPIYISLFTQQQPYWVALKLSFDLKITSTVFLTIFWETYEVENIKPNCFFYKKRMKCPLSYLYTAHVQLGGREKMFRKTFKMSHLM